MKSVTHIKHIPLIIVAPVVFAIVFASTLIYSKLEPKMEYVDAIYVMEHVNQPGYVLVDVRPEENYNGKSPMPGVPGGHIPGAINFPLNELRTSPMAPATLAKLGITRRNTIILYCNTGTASGRFADYLIKRLRFDPRKLKNYRSSIKNWITLRGNRLLPEEHESGY